MIWVLLTAALLLVITGSLATGVIISPWVLAKLMPATGAHSVPVHEVIPAQASHRHATTEPGLLALEAAQEYADAAWQASEPYMPEQPQGQHPYQPAPLRSADLPARRRLTDDHAPTCDFPAVGYAPPPTEWVRDVLGVLTEQARRDQAAYQDSYQAEHDGRGDYGTRPQLAVEQRAGAS